MRPVERGLIPSAPDGTPRVFAEYQDARADLIARFGEYCSYCEGRLVAALAVEHIQPKDGPAGRPDLALSWSNFLLGCVNCNSTKGKKAIVLTDYYWPDRDNTLRMLVYKEGGIVQPHPDLTPEAHQRAQRTIRLVGLDKTPLNDPRAKDRRWNNRREAWDMAQRARRRLAAQDTEHMREEIVEHASARGYWSIWMTAFADDADMRQRLIAAFPGTAIACFDEHGLVVARPGGRI